MAPDHPACGSYKLTAQPPLRVGTGSGPQDGRCVLLEGTSLNFEPFASVIDGRGGVPGDTFRPREGGVFVIAPASRVRLKGVTIKKGHNHTGGGAVENWGALQVENALITESWTHGQGGGILNRGSLTVFNSTISKNTAWPNSDSNPLGGGGIANIGGVVFLTDVTISGKWPGRLPMLAGSSTPEAASSG